MPDRASRNDSETAQERYDRAKLLANPDLPERLRLRAPLTPNDPTTYYGGGAKGYTDYPTLAQERGEQPWPCVDERWR